MAAYEETSLEKRAGLHLTPKQRAFCHKLLETGSAPDAVLAVYDSKSRGSARVIAHQNLKNPKVREYLRLLIVDENLVPAAVLAVRDALRAKVVHRGKQTDIPDHKTRLQAASRIFDLAARVEETPGESSGRERLEEQMLADELSKLQLPILRWMHQQPEPRLPDDEEWDAIMAEWESADLEAKQPVETPEHGLENRPADSRLLPSSTRLVE